MRHTQSTRFGMATAAVLLVALTAAPAAAEHDDDSGTAHAIRSYEKVRALVDRLRHEHAPAEEVRAADRRRKALRSRLWDELRETQRPLLDPVAMDRSGHEGGCPRGGAPDGAEDRPRTWRAPVSSYWLTAGFDADGTHWLHRHTGQDFAVDSGTPVTAVGPGTVWATTCGDGFGNQVLVRHSDGYFSQYAHLSRIDVHQGEHVPAGARLGLSGATGNVTGPHLHFEVRITPYLGSAVSPLPWLERHGVQVG